MTINIPQIVPLPTTQGSVGFFVGTGTICGMVVVI